MQVVHEQFEVYALNIYFNSYNRKRRLLKPLEEWLIDLMSRKPHATFIVAGDFNTPVQPIKYLNTLLDDPGVVTFRRTIRGRLVQSRTDWVLCSHQHEHLTTTHWYDDSSDHCLVMTVLDIPNQRPQATQIKIPDSDAALLLCEEAALSSANLSQFLATLKQLTSRNRHMKKMRLNLRQKKS